MLDIEEKSYHNCLKLIWTLTWQAETANTDCIDRLDHGDTVTSWPV